MSGPLALIVQSLLNTPLALHAARAEMIVAVLHGRLNIDGLLAAEAIHDRAALDRIAAAGRADVAAGGIGVASGPVAQAAGATEVRGKSFMQGGDIAVIQCRGTLCRHGPPGMVSGRTSYEGLSIQHSEAMADPTVKGIWLDINSGGGAVDGMFGLQEQIFLGSARNGGKPTVAMASDQAYSAAYALMVAADECFVPMSGAVGSVGCMAIYADMSRKLDSEGITVEVLRSGADKNLASGVEPLVERQRLHMLAQLDELRDMFSERVAVMRGIEKNVVLETEGLDYMGRHAKAIGFVTDVLPESDAWARLEQLIARR